MAIGALNPNHFKANKETNSQESQEKKKGNKRLIAALMLGASAMAAMGTAFAWAFGGEKAKAEAEALSASKTQIESTQASHETSTNSQELTTESTEMQKLQEQVEQYKGAMAKYEQMNHVEFEKLPREERIAYASYLFDCSRADGTYEKYYGAGGPGSGYAIEYKQVNENSTNQDILSNDDFLAQLSCIQNTIDKDGVHRFDSEKGIKLLSLKYYDVGAGNRVSESYEALKHAMMENGNRTLILTDHTAAIGETARNTSAPKVSEMLTGANKDGQTVNYKIIEATNDLNEIREKRFVYENALDYKGDILNLYQFNVQESNLSVLNNIPI